MNIVVLGAGLVGSAIVKDLAKEKSFKVTAVDINREALKKLASESPAKTICANVQEPGKLKELVAKCDLVICAVPGFMGFETLKKIIEAGKDVVDISFFAEDAFLLDKLAKAKGVTAVVDCGVAPGLCNVMVGYLSTQLDKIDSYICYVGGLPKVRQWPYEYKAVFSPRDVIEEYTRPARFVEYGKEVVRPALSDTELLDFPGAGTLESFNSDGLRSLQFTMDIPFMKEKTLRFPGHVNLMRVFRESGFFSPKPIEVDGQKVSPLSLTSKLLFDQWRMKDGEEDFTVMQVIVEGQKGKKKVCHTYDLFDEFDKSGKISSMARTTGYTCTIVARQVLSGMFKRKGICPPEYVGQAKGCFENLLKEYAKRNITVSEKKD